MSKSMSPIDDQARHPNTAAVIMLLAGFSCLIAWPLLVAVGIPPAPGSGGFLTSPETLRILALLGAFITLVATLRLSVARWIFNHKTSPGLIAYLVFTMVALPICDQLSRGGVAIPLPLLAVLWALFGVSFAVMLLLWGNLWDSYVSLFGKAELWVNLLISIGAALFMSIGAAYTQSGFMGVLWVVIPVLSLATYRGLIAYTENKEDPDKVTIDASVKMPVRHAAYVVAISSYCSFILFFSIETVGAEQTIVTGCFAALTACILFAVFGATKGSLPRFQLVERIAFPVAISGTVVSPFLDNQFVAIIAVFLSVAGTSAFMISHWELMVKWSQRFRLHPIYHFAYGTYTLSAGFLFGGLLNQVIRTLDFPMNLSATVICLLFLFSIITILALQPFDSETAFSSFEQGMVKMHSQEGTWKSVLEGISRSHSLTPREAEVISFLARGRSVKYISDKLCVSEHTTKTHVYHIYKKLDIGNMQELIDLVDAELLEAKSRKL